MASKSYSNSALRVASILESFTHGETELTAAEISRKVGLPKSTVHYILMSLIRSRLLTKNENNGKYTVSPKLFEIGSVYIKNMGIVRIAEPVVKTLNELTNEAVTIGVLNNDSMTRVLREESQQPLRVVAPIGQSVPAYASAMGKALLSELPNEEIDNLYPNERLTKVTKNTIRTKTELKLELEDIRNTGIGFNRGGADEGVEGIAHVIRNSSGKAIAAIAIALPFVRIDEAKRQKIVELVKLGAALISYNLGFSDKTNTVRSIEDVRNWWQRNHW